MRLGWMEKAVWAASIWLLGVAGAAAHDLSADECLEGGDFIEHAAMSRDHGLTRDDFLRRMQEDLQLIQAFPPALRWFVQDAADEALLVNAAQRVFDRPRAPQDHRIEFVRVCSMGVSFLPQDDARVDDPFTPSVTEPQR